MKFTLHDGKEMDIHEDDVKKIVHEYWHNSKERAVAMEEYAEKYHHKAGRNLKNALCLHDCPETEDEVKDIIAYALRHAMMTGDFCTFAEVIYEAMEFENSRFALNVFGE